MSEPRKLKTNESDSMLEHALNHNKTEPIAILGVWYKKGTLKKLLLAAPTTEGENRG